MNKLVTYLSFFGAGCALGVLGTKTYFERKYRDIADNEIESVKEVYKRKTIALEGEEQKEAISGKVVLGQTSIASKEPSETGLFLNMTPEHMKSMQINYNTMSNDIVDDIHPTEGPDKPYFITIDEFDEVNDGFTKLEYSYYMDDSTLVSADDEVISAADTIGVDNLELFENMDEDACFIRNEFVSTDYEVTKVFSSYSMITGDDY